MQREGARHPQGLGDRPRRRPHRRNALPRRRDRTRHIHTVAHGEARSSRVAHPVPRCPQRQARRLLRQQLHRRGRQHEGDRHHADGGDRRPASLSVLGRARPQGGVRHHPRRRRRTPRGLELAGLARRAVGQRQAPGHVPRHHDDVDLPRVLRRRRARSDRADRRGRRPAAGHRPPGQRRAHPLRARGRRVRAPLLRHLVRDPLSGREARPDRNTRFRVRCDGEPRCRHLPRDAAPHRRGEGGTVRPRADRGRREPRDRTHVVR